MMPISLNGRAWRLSQQLEVSAERLRVGCHTVGDTKVWDFGCDVLGGLDAGVLLSRLCLADLARVTLLSSIGLPGTGLSVQVATDHPVSACMRSQYAGWRIAGDDYFAMGSGPMRAAAAVEELFERIEPETANESVGILETRVFPPLEIIAEIAKRCRVPSGRLVLMVAPTASQAGTVQIVARSVETTIHKLLNLGFDPERIVSAFGTAPLPPVAADDLAGIGRTNDAILYGAQVTLWVNGDDASLDQMVSRIPSCSSRDYGEPFSQIFSRYDNDFYKIDPHLFSPAEVCLVNIDSGKSFRAGQVDREILAASFDA